jgi:glycosyltransferase involved in cell wall biosynthesis
MTGKKELRVAVTYHYSLSFGGSERVLEVLAEMYPQADFFTLMADREFLPEKLKGRKITTSFLDRIPGRRRLYRHLLPLYPLAVESLNLSGYDLVISADGAATKGVLTDQKAVHLCYCHSPPRSFWDQYATYRQTQPWWITAPFAPVSQYMRQWDFAAAQRIDGFIVNSHYVAERVQKYYRRQSEVIYPPVDTQSVDLVAEHGESYLSVGRLVASKRIDLLIAACNRLRRKLRIAGSGPEEPLLRSVAGPTIEFLGRVSEDQLKREYATCRALLFAADEDFGLVSVEAQAFGRPVIAYGHGGSLETVRGLRADGLLDKSGDRARYRGYTGVFCSEQTALSFEEAILNFESIENCFDPQVIQEHARRFDTRVFVEEIHRYVEEQLDARSRPRGRQTLAAPINVGH